MTHFDKVLKAAYDAGYSAADNGRDPDFAEWRESLSGALDPDPNVIKHGDLVEIVGTPRIARGYHVFYGRRYLADPIPGGQGYIYLLDPVDRARAAGGVSWPADAVRKVRP